MAAAAATPHPSRLRRATFPLKGKAIFRLRAGRGTRDPSSVSFADTCLPAGRSVRGSDRPPACHSTPRTPQGEGLIPAGRRGRRPLQGEGCFSPAGGTGGPLIRRFADTCLPAGRSVRGSDTPPACHSIPRTPQGEGLIPTGRRGRRPLQREGLGVRKRSTRTGAPLFVSHAK